MAGGHRCLCEAPLQRAPVSCDHSQAKISHRAARWQDPRQRLRPGLVWLMARDDSYFRAKNYGWAGVLGSARAAARDAMSRWFISGVSFPPCFCSPVRLDTRSCSWPHAKGSRVGDLECEVVKRRFTSRIQAGAVMSGKPRQV